MRECKKHSSGKQRCAWCEVDKHKELLREASILLVEIGITKKANFGKLSSFIEKPEIEKLMEKDGK